MKPLMESLALFMPPRWLAAAVVALVAAALLAAFIDALHENLRRGEALRQGQRVGAVRQAVGMVAAAAPTREAPQSYSLLPPTSQR